MIKLNASWLLIKNLFARNRTLFICIEFCICLCFVFALYVTNFITKLCIFNSDNICRVEINDDYASVKGRIDGFPVDKAASMVLYIDGNVSVYLIDSDFPILKGRKPIAANEILSSKLENSGNIGNEISVNGKTYVLVGWSRYIDTDYLVSTAAITDDTVVKEIAISNAFAYSPNEFNRLVERNFKGYAVTPSPKVGIDDLFNSASAVLPIILVLALAVATLSLTLQYLLNKLSAAVDIFVLCGYNTRSVLTVMMVAALILLTIPLIAGEIVYLPLENLVLNEAQSLSLGVKYSLSFGNHIEIIACFTILIVIFILPNLRRLSSKKVKVGYDA